MVLVPVLQGGGEDGVPDYGLGERFAWFVGWVGRRYPDEYLLCVPGEERRQIWRI